jgi:D-beta-D-heptose 7-phosphate kinase/D-beta-D-heptose 1-phosphate adenosyltransferase
MNFERYTEIVRGYTGRRILVFGDLMMDEYLWGSATRISPESPVMVVDVERETRVPGGAANVVNNLLALGAEVHVVGVVGDDAGGELLRTDLRERGADIQGIITDATRPTTRKTRVVAHSQQVLRVDREQKHPVNEDVTERLLTAYQARVGGCEAILVSDYAKGLLTEEIARSIVRIANREHVPTVCNLKPKSARFFQGANLITLNQIEAEQTAELLGLPGVTVGTFAEISALEATAPELVKRLVVETLIVTRSAKGLSLLTARGVEHIAPHLVEVYDGAGAGDTVISALTLGMTAGGSVAEAAFLANRAGACVVRKLGVATITQEEILADW